MSEAGGGGRLQLAFRLSRTHSSGSVPAAQSMWMNYDGRQHAIKVPLRAARRLTRPTRHRDTSNRWRGSATTLRTSHVRYAPLFQRPPPSRSLQAAGCKFGGTWLAGGLRLPRPCQRRNESGVAAQRALRRPGPTHGHVKSRAVCRLHIGAAVCNSLLGDALSFRPGSSRWPCEQAGPRAPGDWVARSVVTSNRDSGGSKPVLTLHFSKATIRKGCV